MMMPASSATARVTVLARPDTRPFTQSIPITAYDSGIRIPFFTDKDTEPEMARENRKKVVDFS